MQIIPKSDKHNELVGNDLLQQFGSEHIISINRQYNKASELPGFIAEEENSPTGIVLYFIKDQVCELAYLHAFKTMAGIGKELVDYLINFIRNKSIDRLFVITTNDNLEALKFYQKQGFKLVKVYPDAMEKVREIKPEVPLTGKNNIPLRDMMELEMIF